MLLKAETIYTCIFNIFNTLFDRDIDIDIDIELFEPPTIRKSG